MIERNRKVLRQEGVDEIANLLAAGLTGTSLNLNSRVLIRAYFEDASYRVLVDYAVDSLLQLLKNLGLMFAIVSVIFADYGVCSGGKGRLFCDGSWVEFDRAGCVEDGKKDVSCPN